MEVTDSGPGVPSYLRDASSSRFSNRIWARASAKQAARRRKWQGRQRRACGRAGFASLARVGGGNATARSNRPI